MARLLTTMSDWLAENPPAADRLTQTLAGISARVRRDEDFDLAVREFLDEFAFRSDDESRAAAIADPPLPTGDARWDAFLGALGEHLALAHDLERPSWTTEPSRFLERFWFVSDLAAELQRRGTSADSRRDVRRSPRSRRPVLRRRDLRY